jgi:tetratricopeptide (TPR) repeat protein
VRLHASYGDPGATVERRRDGMSAQIFIAVTATMPTTVAGAITGEYDIVALLAVGVIVFSVAIWNSNRNEHARVDKIMAKADAWEAEEREKQFANRELANGETASAITILEELRCDYEESPDPDDPAILQVCDLLAEAYTYAGRYDDSLDLHETNVAACRESLGWDHPFTLKCRVNLAHAYSMVDRDDEAIAFHEEALADSRATLGADHPESLGSQGGLAWLLLRADRADEAIALYEETLADCRRALGDDHYLTEDIAEKLDTTKEIVAEEEQAP